MLLSLIFCDAFDELTILLKQVVKGPALACYGTAIGPMAARSPPVDACNKSE